MKLNTQLKKTIMVQHNVRQIRKDYEFMLVIFKHLTENLGKFILIHAALLFLTILNMIRLLLLDIQLPFLIFDIFYIILHLVSILYI